MKREVITLKTLLTSPTVINTTSTKTEPEGMLPLAYIVMLYILQYITLETCSLVVTDTIHVYKNFCQKKAALGNQKIIYNVLMDNDSN